MRAADGDPGDASGAEMYGQMRAMALATRPDELGVERADGAVPYGILMETGYPQAVVTLVSFTSGDASLYFSNGGGIIGGIGHEHIRTAAQRFVQAAAAHLNAMRKAAAFPEPAVGATRFYVLTTEGVFTAEAPENELGSGGTAPAPLFFAGQDVIAGLLQLQNRAKEQN